MSEPIIHEGKKYTMDTFLFVVLSVFVLCLSSTLFFVGSYSDAVMALRDDNTKSIHRTNGSDNSLSLLVGGTLIDGTGAPPQPDVSIAIYGSKIIAVTNKTNLTDNLFYNAILGKGKPMILNLTGKYIVPGFFDMHAHVAGVLKGGVGRSLNNSIYTLIIGYVTYIPIFVYLFFRANRVRYRDPTSGALNSRNLIRDIWKLFTAFSGSEVVFILTKTYIHFQQLELGYLEAYEAYFVAELVAWGVYFVSMNTILRAVKMYNIRGNSKSTRTPH
jgi:hypothetical protein